MSNKDATFNPTFFVILRNSKWLIWLCLIAPKHCRAIHQITNILSVEQKTQKIAISYFFETFVFEKLGSKQLDPHRFRSHNSYFCILQPLLYAKIRFLITISTRLRFFKSSLSLRYLMLLIFKSHRCTLVWTWSVFLFFFWKINFRYWINRGTNAFGTVKKCWIINGVGLTVIKMSDQPRRKTWDRLWRNWRYMSGRINRVPLYKNI